MKITGSLFFCLLICSSAIATASLEEEFLNSGEDCSQMYRKYLKQNYISVFKTLLEIKNTPAVDIKFVSSRHGQDYIKTVEDIKIFRKKDYSISCTEVLLGLEDQIFMKWEIYERSDDWGANPSLYSNTVTVKLNKGRKLFCEMLSKKIRSLN